MLMPCITALYKHMKEQHIYKMILVCCFVLVLAGLLSIFLKNYHPNQEINAICSQDAKLCSDGSYVSRHGPKCEFSDCPQVQLNNYSDSAVEFQYPNLTTKYISGQVWPPKVSVQAGNVNCPAASSTIISGQVFCTSASSEGAAGSIYTNYMYSSEIQNKDVTFQFTLRFVQCGNYNGQEKTECEAERTNFLPDALLIPILQSLKLHV